jgi:hypothetical protein
VASLQDDSVGVATALSPVGAGHFKFYHTTFIVGLGLILREKIRHRFGRTNVEISTLAPIRQQPIFDTIFKAKRQGGA